MRRASILGGIIIDRQAPRVLFQHDDDVFSLCISDLYVRFLCAWAQQGVSSIPFAHCFSYPYCACVAHVDIHLACACICVYVKTSSSSSYVSVATNESVCLFDMWLDLLDLLDATSSCQSCVFRRTLPSRWQSCSLVPSSLLGYVPS